MFYDILKLMHLKVSDILWFELIEQNIRHHLNNDALFITQSYIIKQAL